MPDVNDVIKGLTAHGYHDCHSCPYWGSGKNGMSECKQLARDALALLKEYVEMEKNYSQVLMETTGNLLSKTSYTVPAIMDCIQNHYCDRCDVKEERDALLKAQECATVEPKRPELSDETKAWLDKMDAVKMLSNIADICIDWDGYRTADGLGGLINEIWAYARYGADKLMKEQSQRDYEAATEMTEYCERYEPTYNPEDGSM